MFNGFTDKTFEFFMALRFNNNREFFYDNHDWYMESVRRPLIALAAELGDEIKNTDENLELRPERNVSRINRDLRFSRDKSPYRDWMWISFYDSADRYGSIGFYADISAEHVGWGVGIYDENRALMDAHRKRLSGHAPEFISLIDGLGSDFGVNLSSRKRMQIPEALPEKVKKWYPLRSFDISNATRDIKLMTSPELADVIKRDYARLSAVYKWFAARKAEII
ncbi:MAG: DUF2461 domain-containing protein [Clostridia bacterium]|nr:DUF2461 domain-containing protein [Clostridia bacterium]